MDKTVLIIDDDEMLRRTLAAGLRAEGFDVIGAESAMHASKILEKMHVAAIVLDRMMVGQDGLSFLINLRATGDTTPVIMLTALSGPENAIAGLSGGANDYLAKPFQMKELILRLNNIMKNNPSTGPSLPPGLIFTDGEFFIQTDNTPARALALSGEEKRLLSRLTSPIGNIAPAAPMVAKRLRTKLNSVLSHIDIITIRGHGYKIVTNTPVIITKNKDTV
ncbi:response regulator transcription factor [bacterium]|nr:response regulator transcription factor [bacterium]